MSDQAESKKKSDTTSVNAIKALWDEKELKKRDLAEWIGILSGTVSTNTLAEPATVESDELATGSNQTGDLSTNDSGASDSDDSQPEATSSSTADTRRIFVPEDKYCGIWHNSPNKERHASFGDDGTTASASCFGELVQMSQYLGVGHSGVFTLDQPSTDEPYLVRSRARHLDTLASNIGDNFSFLHMLPDGYSPEGKAPPELRWVNWRWPRYHYPHTHTGIKCLQYMIHEGVVLQQFTLENTSNEPIELGPFEMDPTVLIRDLDFVDGHYPFNEAMDNEEGYSYRLGPNGYGHICVHTLPGHEKDCKDGPKCQEHAVASVTTTFVNGRAIKFDSRNQRSCSFLKGHKLGNSKSGTNKVEIVVARKLILLPKHAIDWRNFVISAEASDINHWLREEIRNSWRKDESLTSCFERLPMTTTKGINTGSARDEKASEEKTSLHFAFVPSFLALVRADGNDADAEVTGLSAPTDSRSFPMPAGKPHSGSDWNPARHLEYLAWRHLEHVLSVCAMPLRVPGLIEVDGSGVKLGARKASTIPEVALTCGDISGHRINTSASFFAFKFLVHVGCLLQRLDARHKTPYITGLERRIKTACSGHIKWLRWIRKAGCNPPTNPAERPPWSDEEITNEHIIQLGCFAANYWATGKVMTRRSDYFTWTPQNRMKDTALQIVKLAEYKKLVHDSKDEALRNMMQKVLDDVYVPWLTELDRMDIRKTCSWPHSNVNGIIKFRLDDHFWIWKALRCLDDVVTKIRLPTKQHREDFKEIPKKQKKWLKTIYEKDSVEEGVSPSSIRKFLEIAKRLSPNNLQRTVLQRFTAENDVLKPAKRMLAAARSAMDMRFLLHARDTALFYDENVGFFVPGSSFMQLWQNTIDAQLHHEENMYGDSDKALRYALGIVMGVRGHTLSRTNNLNAFDLVKGSINILLGAGGSDAFFPGQLDEGGREPTIFSQVEHRDRFYHAGFEINYVLLSSATEIEKLLHGRAVNSTTQSRSQESPPVYKVSGPYPQPGQADTTPKIITNNLQVISGTDNTVRVVNNQAEVTMKKSLPFTNVIPATNVNHIGDEWLYQYPDFLRDRLDIQDSELQTLLDASKSSPKSFVQLCRFILIMADVETDSLDFEDDTNHSDMTLHVMDIRKGNQRPDKRRTMPVGPTAEKLPPKAVKHLITGTKELFDVLGKPRSAWTAKKRIVWLPHADRSVALACCVLSPDREKSVLHRFFGRHTRYTKDVLDQTSMALNEWQTELYLSFYLLVEKDTTSGSRADLPNRDSNSVPFPGPKDYEIRRAAMAFRFDGDLFDRFWTCHFIDHMTVKGLEWDQTHWIHQRDLDKQWSQRKVLELYFVHRILENIAVESIRFPETVRRVLGIKQGSLALVLPSSIKASMDELQQFGIVLQLVEEDLAANLATLSEKWNRREADRGQEKPRWTANDEKKYRANINKLCVDIERATGKLKANQADIRKLREFLAATRKNRRNDQERRRDADLRYLTYVTVIFQPLAFAASFYSMGGAPEPALIVSLVEFSAAAFAVTLLLILGYRALASRHEKNAARKESLEKSPEKKPEKSSEEPSEKPSEESSRKSSEEMPRKPIDGNTDVREGSQGLALSLRAVVNLLLSIVDQLARFILWCWEREVVIKTPSSNLRKEGFRARTEDSKVPV